MCYAVPVRYKKKSSMIFFSTVTLKLVFGTGILNGIFVDVTNLDIFSFLRPHLFCLRITVIFVFFPGKAVNLPQVKKIIKMAWVR